MPTPGMAWRHVVINTLNSWHHGDARGFRSRDHRIHSSGDYKNRPPIGEHAGLLRYRKEDSGPEITIDQDLRAIVGQTLVAVLLEMNFRFLAASIADKHGHAIVELPSDLCAVKRIIGDAKRRSSRSIKQWLPGRVWSAGGTYKMVRDRSHLKSATEYVLYDQGDDAWTWSYRDESNDGLFARQRPKPARR